MKTYVQIVKHGAEVHFMTSDQFCNALTLDCIGYLPNGELDQEECVDLWNQLQDRTGSPYRAIFLK